MWMLKEDMGRSVGKRDYMLSSDSQKTGFHMPKQAHT